jgi:tRNA(adenine34) deaminase
MRMALQQAEAARAENEVPVGAVIVQDGRVIAAAYNQREQLRDPTAHAEMIAITQAAESVGGWRLERCQLYVTLEPCPMCAGALWASRISGVVFGAENVDAGALGTLYHLGQDPRLNHEFPVRGRVLADECGDLLRAFFGERR